MSVTTTPNTEYCGNELIKIFHKKALQQQLAKEFIDSAAEAHLEMLVDDGDIKNFADFSVHVNAAVKQSSIEMMYDMVDDLRRCLEDYINQIEVRATSALFDDEGFAGGNILVEGIPRDNHIINAS